jgi:hypothetical protein
VDASAATSPTPKVLHIAALTLAELELDNFSGMSQMMG